MTASSIYPLRIEPRYVERIWGGHALANRLGKAAPQDKPIGESWEIFEENRVLNGAYEGQTIGALRQSMAQDLMGHVASNELFPLLTKLIDAQDVLSVQVHPDDRFAREHEGQPYGKTECWYVIHAEPGATLTYGFSQDSNPDEYQRLVAEGSLDKILRSLPVQAGDVVYIPAGTVHAIGAGIIVYELQQTSDVTYRIYDWNRRDSSGNSRELHVDKARQVLDYHRWTRDPIQPLRQEDGQRSMLIAGPYFCMELVTSSTPLTLSTYNSPVAICTLQHTATVRAGQTEESVSLNRYSSALIPAAAETFVIEPQAQDEVMALIAYVPQSPQATRSDLAGRGFAAHVVDDFLAQFAPAQDLGQGVSHD